MPGFMGLEALTKSFVTPMIANTFSSINANVSNQLFPQNNYYPPYQEEPWQYLSPSSAVNLPTTWWNTIHFMGSLTSITALYVGFGAALGIGAAGCAGRGKQDHDDESYVTDDEDDGIDEEIEVFSDDPEAMVKHEVINII
jgi:hypothetical protein